MKRLLLSNGILGLLLLGCIRHSVLASEIGNAEIIHLLEDVNANMQNRMLTVNSFQKKIGGTPTQTENKQYWYIGDGTYPVRVTLKSVEKSQPVTEVDITFNTLNLLSLADLQRLYGEYSIVMVSKTSTVIFRPSSAGKTGLLTVYAHLYYPPTNANAPVMSVSIRSGHDVKD